MFLQNIIVPGKSNVLFFGTATANVTLASTSSASPTSIIAGSSITYQARPILIEFSAPYIQRGVGAPNIGLYDGTSFLCTLAAYNDGNGSMYVPCFARMRFTPTAASHTYQIQGWSGSTGDAVVFAGSGTAGANAPATLRITYDD